MRHLVVSGTPHERGLQHGRAWAKEIRAFFEIRKDLLKQTLHDWPQKKFDKLIEAHLNLLYQDKEIWEELTGICEGSGMEPCELMILNNHTDLRDFAKGDFDESFMECSCFAFKQGDRIIAGQTWDMHASARPFVAHLTVKEGDHQQEIFTLTGCLGLTGVSSKKFGVFINNLRSLDLAIGYAWPAVVRKLLKLSSLAEAESTLRKHMPSAGRNFLLVDHENAANFEVSAKDIARVGDLRSGYVFHTNHYLSALKAREELTSRSKTTFDRYEHLAKVIPPLIRQPLSVERIGEELLNKSEGIISIPAPKDPHGSATCGGLIYDYSKMSGVSFEGLYSEGDHLKI